MNEAAICLIPLDLSWEVTNSGNETGFLHLTVRFFIGGKTILLPSRSLFVASGQIGKPGIRLYVSPGRYAANLALRTKEGDPIEDIFVNILVQVEGE